MAVANTFYGNTLRAMINGDVAWDTGTWKMTLILDSITPNKEHDYLDDISASQATGQTDQTLTTTAAAASAGTVTCDVNDATVTFSSVTGSQTIGGVAVYRDSGVASTSELFVLCDFDAGNIVSDGTNDIVITPGASGVATVTY